MTTPNPFAQYGMTETDAHDALAEVGRYMTGSKMLQNEPGVIYDLAAKQASPQDAGAIDQFMQALDAERQVSIARAAQAAGGGGYINLTKQQQQLLDNQGVAYNDVLYSKSTTAAQQAGQYVKASTGGAYTVKTNPDGTLALDKHGNVQRIAVVQPGQPAQGSLPTTGPGLLAAAQGSPGGGIGDAIGQVWDDTGGAVVHALKVAGSDSWDALTKAYNAAQSGVTLAQGAMSGNAQDLATSAQDMQAQGYDPSSFWSSMAFLASGNAHTDLSALNKQYGVDSVNQALVFQKDPKAFRDNLLNDPSNWTTGADGSPMLTADAKNKLAVLDPNSAQGKQFQEVVQRVSSQLATPGNELMNVLHVDPIQHPIAYQLGAAGTNLAVGFAIDPTSLGLNALKGVKLAQVGLDTLGDGDRAASILLRTSKLPWVNNVQRGWQRAIDLGGQMREAHAAGDTAQMAKLDAQFSAELPGLAPLKGEFSGLSRIRYAKDGTPEVFNDGTRIDSLDTAATWLKGEVGFNLIKEGRAATQTGLMPGALSALGYRKVKGAIAGWNTSRSLARDTAAGNKVLSAAAADPQGLGETLIKQGILERILPSADNAVVVANDQVLADQRTLAEAEHQAEAGFEVPAGEPENFYQQMVTDARSKLESSQQQLASANRAALEKTQLALTPAGKGTIALSQAGKTTETALDELTKTAKFGPLAIAQRSRLAATRLTTLLPRNTALSVNDTDSADKVFRFMRTYVGTGQANLARAVWANGTSADRKQLVQGILDQVAHAAGFGVTQSGRNFLDAMHAETESYAAHGDDLLVNGKPMALTEGQTRTVFTLPSFRALRKNAAKLGLWDSTFSRAGESRQVDNLMAMWKSGMLAAPKTAPRNMIEGWLRAILEGQAGNALKAKAVMTSRNKDLWNLGYDTKNGRLAGLKQDYENALAEGDTAKANEIANGQMLAGDELGKSRANFKLSDVAILRPIARAYRAQYLKHMSEDHINAILDVSPDELAEIARGYHSRILESDLGFANGAKQATAIAKAGYGPALFRLAFQRAKAASGVESKVQAWAREGLDGGEGADRYANELHRRVDAMPESSRAIIDYIQNGKNGDLSEVIKALEKESQNTEFGRVHFPDPIGSPNEAYSTSVRSLAEAGKTPYAQKLVDEFEYLLTGRNQVFQKDLAKYIRDNGKAPSSDWIQNRLHGDNRPVSALAPHYIAMPNGGSDPENIANALQDTTGAAFQWLIERTIQRTTSMPIYMANYATERVGLEKQIPKLIAAGVEPEAAKALAEDIAMRRAFTRTEQIIDDPGQKTQFDVIARNFFPWSRAVSAMMRRWGAGLWQNPLNARRMMLAYEGAVQSGLIYTNAYGEPTFTYPGSGVFADVMRELSNVPGFKDIASFPIAGDMTGSVLMSVPGADNPFRLSMSPMLTIPLRTVYKHFLPTSWRGALTSADTLINGPIGVGQTWQTLIPSYVQRGMTAMGISTDGQNASLASAMNGSIAYLAAAGLIPKTNATADELNAFRNRVQTQTKNVLFARFVFGLIAPAAPSVDEGVNESVAQSEFGLGSQADFAWKPDGIKLLGDEFKSILNEMQGNVARALAVWTYLHPDQVIYKVGPDGKPVEVGNPKLPSALTVSQSQSTTHGAYLPSTDSAFNWLTKNADFVSKYKSVAAYFLPQPTINEPFSDAAYKAQIEFGLRVKKAPDQFLNDIYVRHAESSYYQAAKEYDLKIQQATLTGDDNAKAYWTKQKSAWEQEYKQLNPLLEAKQRQDHYAAALDQLGSIRNMLQAGKVPDGLGPQLDTLVRAWDSYESFIKQNAGNTKAEREARSNALVTFNTWAQNHVAGTPLVDLYNGVFRSLNTNLDQIQGGVAP